MLAEDQFKKIRPIRWKKDQKPVYRLVVDGVSREDERTLKKTARAMGVSWSVFFAVLGAAFRDHRVIILPDGAMLDTLIEDRLVSSIDRLVETRVKAILADANLGDEYLR